MSGVASVMGQNWLRGAQLGAEEVNAAGGINIGGVRYNVEIPYADDKYTTTGGTEAGNKLIYEDKVRFIFSNTTAGTFAFRPMAEKEKVIILSASTSEALLGPTHPLTFRSFLQTLNTLPNAYIWLKNNTTVKTLGVINPNDDAGKAGTKTTKDMATVSGFQVTSEEYYERGTTDFYSTLTKVMAKNPDMIDLGVMLETQNVLKQLYELGYKGYKLTSILVTGARGVAKDIGADKEEGIITYFQPVDGESATASEGEKKFQAAYKAKYGDWPENWYSEATYSWLRLIFPAALPAAGSLDPDKVANALADVEVDSLVPGYKIKFYESIWGIKRELSYPSKVAVVRNGRVEVLARVASGNVYDLFPNYPRPTVAK